MINILGIDPSLTATGWAVGDDTGTISGDAGEGDTRLFRLYVEIQLLSEVVDYAVLEDLPVHGQGAGKTGMAQGVIRFALQHNLVPYVTVPPATLKKFATGKGNATKPDMRMSLYQRTGVDVRDDNQVDAAWLRYLGYALADQLPFSLPQTHMSALAKLSPLELVNHG